MDLNQNPITLGNLLIIHNQYGEDPVDPDEFQALDEPLTLRKLHEIFRVLGDEFKLFLSEYHIFTLRSLVILQSTEYLARQSPTHLVVSLGCGSGILESLLQNSYPGLEVLGIDIAPPQHLNFKFQRLDWGQEFTPSLLPVGFRDPSKYVLLCSYLAPNFHRGSIPSKTFAEFVGRTPYVAVIGGIDNGMFGNSTWSSYIDHENRPKYSNQGYDSSTGCLYMIYGPNPLHSYVKIEDGVDPTTSDKTNDGSSSSSPSSPSSEILQDVSHGISK